MYLFIDPSRHESVRLVVLRADVEQEYIYQVKNRELLHMIVDTLDREGESIGDIEGIVVLVGVGGFSSTRIASVVVNTLAFALRVPVASTTQEHIPTSTTVATFFGPESSTQYILPTYSGEPNIGTSS